MLKLCPIKLRVGGGEGLQNESIFSAVHEISRKFEILTPKTFTPPPQGGVTFWAAHDISRTFDFLTH